MAISYFGKNGPITIRELIDEYSSDTTLLIFLIQQEPYEISEADKTQSIIANNKEPSIDNTPRGITYCRDCCRKKHLTDPEKPGERLKSNCPEGYLPPISNPNWRPDYKIYPQPTSYPEYPYCCDENKTPPYIPPLGFRRHNEPSWQPGGGRDSRYVQAMNDCLKRKNVKSKPFNLLSLEDRAKVEECLNEIKLMFQSRIRKDELCEEENRKIKACIAACMAATTDGVLPIAASGCGEKPSTQTN